MIVTKFPWAASGRAQTIGRTEGLTKMILEPKTERILGVGIVGPGAGELIAEGVLAVETASCGPRPGREHPRPPNLVGNDDGSRRVVVRPGDPHVPAQAEVAEFVRIPACWVGFSDRWVVA